MTKNSSKATKELQGKLIASIIVLVLSTILCVGATFAWFSSYNSAGSRLIAGRLNAELFLIEELDGRVDENARLNNVIYYGADNEVNFGKPSLDPDHRSNAKLVELNNTIPTDYGYRKLKLTNNGSIAFNSHIRLTTTDSLSSFAHNFQIKVAYFDDANVNSDVQGFVNKSVLLSGLTNSETDSNGLIMYYIDIDLGQLLVNSQRDIVISYEFLQSAGNDAQEQNISFDFVIFAVQAI